MLMKVWPVKTNVVCRDPRHKNNFEHSLIVPKPFGVSLYNSDVESTFSITASLF
jgi:hypothetical protein